VLLARALDPKKGFGRALKDRAGETTATAVTSRSRCDRAVILENVEERFEERFPCRW
jgi:hypothetical protein